ncbi:ABC transporter permease [Vibrio natriegens]|uniref:ABC transporter permease n=1 Tax=Vibrio natriegens TaxID=691 RepID=UPI003DA1C32B
MKTNKTLSETTLSLLGLLALVFGVFSLLIPGQFLTSVNFSSMAFQLPELGLLTLGMFIAMLSGGLNLSIIATSNITAIFMAWVFVNMMPADAGVAFQIMWLMVALAGAFIIAIAIGALSGYFVSKIGIHPILVTLAVMTTVNGFGIWLTHGAAISNMPSVVLFIGHESILGVPVSMLLFLAAAFALYIFLERTHYGKYVYMYGSNINATYFSGINTHKVTTYIYVISNLMCVLAGLVMMARFNSARMGYGESYLLLTVLAVILGGTDPFGGFGRVFDVVLALFTLQIISTGLNLMGISQHFNLAMWGIALLSVLIYRFLKVKYSARIVQSFRSHSDSKTITQK